MIQGWTTLTVGVVALIYWLFTIAYLARGNYKAPTGKSMLYDKAVIAIILSYWWFLRVFADDYPVFVAVTRPYATIVIAGAIGISGAWRLYLFIKLNGGTRMMHNYIVNHFLIWRKRSERQPPQ